MRESSSGLPLAFHKWRLQFAASAAAEQPRGCGCTDCHAHPRAPAALAMRAAPVLAWLLLLQLAVRAGGGSTWGLTEVYEVRSHSPLVVVP
jgi:hypothetical protein